MQALKDKQGNIINNFNDIVRVAENFYAELCSLKINHPLLNGSSNEQDTEIPYVTTYEVRRAIRDMPRGITADLITDGGEFIWKKLATLYNLYIKTATVPVSWKNASIY